MRKLATFLDYSDVNIQCRASVSGMDSAMSVGVSGRAEGGVRPLYLAGTNKNAAPQSSTAVAEQVRRPANIPEQLLSVIPAQQFAAEVNAGNQAVKPFVPETDLNRATPLMAGNILGKYRQTHHGQGEFSRLNKRPIVDASLRCLIKVVSVGVVLAAIFSFVFGIGRVNDLGMVPNVEPGDMLLFYRLPREYKVGEVIAFRYQGKIRAARIVARPGDTVNIDSAGLKVNDAGQYEPKIFKETRPLEAGIAFPVTLKPDEYFILGDNRDKTTDSRIFGPIKKNEISGRVFSVVRNRGI